MVSNAFTGTRTVEYAITEYTTSGKTVLARGETGIGSYNTATEVLTRTKVLSTWDGTNYLPKFGTATAPTALSFGTTAAKIDVTVSPMAAGIIPTVPFVYGVVANVADGLGSPAINFSASGSTQVQISGTVSYIPILIGHTGPFTQVALRSVVAITGGAPLFDASIYEVASDGSPGRQIVSFTQLTAFQAIGTYQLTAPLFHLPPGWYWLATLFQAGGATGSFTMRASTIDGAGPGGSLLLQGGPFGSKTLAAQTALNNPATAPTAVANSTLSPLMLFK